MEEPIREGGNYRITRDIIIRGVPAFVKGETVLIEKIEPNKERPAYKFVVFSQRLQKRFQFCDADFEVATQPTVSTPSTISAPGPQSPAQTMPKLSAKREKLQTVLIVGVIAVVVIGCIAFVVNSHYSHEREVKEQIEAADEMGREVVGDARMAIGMFYNLRELEKDPAANAVQIVILEAEIIEKYPVLVSISSSAYSLETGLGPTEEHIEWIEEFLEETKDK